MKLRRRWLLAVLALGVATAAGAPALAEQASGALAGRSTVRIAQGGLEPATIEVGPGDVVSWDNTSVHLAVVTFPESVRERFVCDDLEPAFHGNNRGSLVSTGIRSLPFALPCPLEPGEHPYTVHLLRTDDAPGVPVPRPAPIENPSASHHGLIRVK